MVIVEAISVILRLSAIQERYPGGQATFESEVPNQTFCTDGEIVRVGFMSPADVERFVRRLEVLGLPWRGESQQIAIVDQMTGPTVPCSWLEVHDAKVGENPVKAASLVGSCIGLVAVPRGWSYAQSLSRSAGYVPAGQVGKSLDFVRNEDGLDIYRSKLTGEDVFVGRAESPAEADVALRRRREIEQVVNRALELENAASAARSAGDEDRGMQAYVELEQHLLPSALRLAEHGLAKNSFAQFAAGLVLRVLRRYEQALLYFRRSLESQPDVINTLQEITLCLGELDRPAEAEKFALRAVQIDPKSAAAWGNLAMCLVQLGERRKAREALDQALAIDPADEQNRYIDENFDRYFV